MAPTYAQPPTGPDTERSANPSDAPAGPTPPADTEPVAPAVTEPTATAATATSSPEPFDERLWKAVLSRNDKAVIDLAAAELERLRVHHGINDDLCLLGFYEPKQRIMAWQADRIVSALKANNPLRAKDTLLVLRAGR